MSIREKCMAVINAIGDLWEIFSFFVRIIFQYLFFTSAIPKPERRPRSPSPAIDSSVDLPTSPSVDVSTQEILMDAINVVRSLPRNVLAGEYQPFKDSLLRFYAYYNRGLTDRNNQPTPSGWHDCPLLHACENLEDLSKVETLQEYVKELKMIIESMRSTYPDADNLDMVADSVEHNNEIDLNEFEMHKRNTTSSMDIDLDVIANRIAQIELKLNKIHQEIKRLIK